mgnify:CR=1 FL=1
MHINRGFDLTMTESTLRNLPPNADINTPAILKQAVKASIKLGELKGLLSGIPNAAILVDTLSLQEAKDSSEIESIITTQDEMYKADIFSEFGAGTAAKEVSNYARALRIEFAELQTTGSLRIQTILNIQSELVGNDAGFRALPGTVLKNDATGETLYTPPQNLETIRSLMDNLVAFINDDSICDADPLVKMAIIHYQFESIHPFYDGNGRTGRILNIVYLVLKKLLDYPVLYMSRYIISERQTYYQLIQNIHETGDWENWIVFMLRGVERTASQTIELINHIRIQMQEMTSAIQTEFPRWYSQDLINTLFKHPYTRIEFIERDLSVTRLTAAKYLNGLAAKGLLTKHKIGRNNYYVNFRLFELFLKGIKE